MKFEKKRLKFVVPLTVVVAVSSTIMVFNRFEEIPSIHKFLILVGATFFTAIISYFLFPTREESENDVGPY